MARCEMCGNDYDKSFTVTMAGTSEARTFDSFECAVHALAPTCPHCDAASWVTGWSPTARSTAAPTALARAARPGCGIAPRAADAAWPAGLVATALPLEAEPGKRRP
jgi:hypothetical protein